MAFIAILAVFFYFRTFPLWFRHRENRGKNLSYPIILDENQKSTCHRVHCSAMIESPQSRIKTITRYEIFISSLSGQRSCRTRRNGPLESASKANIDLGFQMATAIDLAGRDVFEAVQMSVNPKVIDTPPVTAVAKDGIQLIAKARVTVRANIRQLVGGAGEDTILARVGEGIVSSIGSSESHKQVLENPDSISKLVLKKGLDSGTAFEILSIDIADIDIGKNIGATLQMDQAQADKKHRTSKSRRTSGHGYRSRTRNESQSTRGKSKSNRSRSRSSQSYGGSLSFGKSRNHGLL